MEIQKHWAESLEIGDKCLATIRHKIDGEKNIHNAKIIVIENDKNNRIIKGNLAFTKDVYDLPYNELSENKCLCKEDECCSWC